MPKSTFVSRAYSAAQAWRAARAQAAERIAALKAQVQAQCAEEPDALRAQLDGGLARLDAALDTIDPRLADALLAADLATARRLLGPIAAAVQADPMIAHADANPFGVKTGLKAMVADALARVSQAVGPA